MISLDEVNKTILDLEQHDTTFATCEKLAWLYIVKDHLTSPVLHETVSRQSGSEFLEICSGLPIDVVLSVLDEHFEVVKALYPKEYDSVIKKIRNIDRA